MDVKQVLKKKQRKKYVEGRVNKSINPKTIDSEKEYLKEVVDCLFDGAEHLPKTELLFALSMELYDSYATKIALHAWRKSSSRRSYIICCIYVAAKQLAIAYPVKKHFKKFDVTIKEVMFYRRLFFKPHPSSPPDVEVEIPMITIPKPELAIPELEVTIPKPELAIVDVSIPIY